MSKYLNKWLQIGKNNIWISEATDPEFTLKSFYECHSPEELFEIIDEGNWCLGQAYYYQDICFINQINGGDEWLVIKQDTDFESFTVGAIGRDKFLKTLAGIQAATIEQCRKLEYR